jgi:hypothetical protein
VPADYLGMATTAVSAREALGRREGFVLACSAGMAFLGVVGLWVARDAGSNFARDLVDLVETGVAWTAALLCWRTGRAQTGRDRRGWLLLAGSALFWGLGQGIWSYLSIVARSQPFPSPADFFYAAAFPLSVVGLLSFQASPSGLAQRLRAVLDGLIVWLSILFVAWALVLGPIYRAGRGAALLSLAYPAADVVLVSVALTVAARARQARPFAFIAGGTLLFALADGIAAYLGIKGASQGVGLPDAAWIGGFVLIALGALRQKGASELRPASGTGRLAAFLPFAAWPAVLAIVGEMTLRGLPVEPVLVWVALALTAVFLTRQASPYPTVWR